MARNRKAQTAAVRFGPAVKTFLLCLLIGGAGVGYVNLKNRIHLLNEHKNKLEARHEKLLRDRQVLMHKLAAQQSATELEAQVRRMNLGLAPVSPDRVVHLTRPAGDATLGRNERLYAEQLVRVPVQQ